MQMTSRVSTDSQTQNQIAVSSQLMQNYRLAKPFLPGGRIATAFNATSNKTEFFTTNSSGRLIYIYSDSSSDTGWSIMDMDFATNTFDACDQPDGTIVVYALDSGGDIHSNTKKGNKWQGWTPVPSPVGNPPVSPYKLISIQDIKVHRIEGSKAYGKPAATYVWALCNVTNTKSGENIQLPAVLLPNIYSPPAPTWYWTGYLGPTTDSWCPAFVASLSWEVYFYGAYTFGSVAETLGPGNKTMPAGTALQQCRVAEPYQGVFRLYDPTGSYSCLTACPGWNQFPTFGYACTDELFALRTDTTSGGKTLPYHLHFDLTSQMFSPRKLSDVPASAIAARTINPGENGRIEVFVIGEDKFLYHMRQQDDNRSNWTDFLKIYQDTTFHQVFAGRDPGLYSEAFAISTDGRVLHVWQDDPAGNWNFDWVELGTSNDLESTSTYTMKVTVFDNAGVPAPGTAVSIFSKEPVILDINGLTCLVRPDLPWDDITLAKGTVTIGMNMESLGMPLLHIRTAFMPEDDRILLDGSAPIRDRLSQINAAGLDAAQVTADNGQQTPLLNAEGRKSTDTLVKTLHASMKVANQLIPKPVIPPSRHREFFHRLNDHRVTTYIPGGTAPAGNAGEALPVWELDFSTERPVFKALNSRQAEEIRTELAALPDLSSAQGEQSWSWGSVFDAILEGLFSLGKILVDGLNVTLHLIIDGVSHVFYAVLGFIEQVFDIVEEAFRKLEIAFEELFRWLGYIFAWDDILRSQEAIEHLWQQMLDLLKTSIKKIESIAEPGGMIDGFKHDLDGKFNDFIADILPPDMTISSLQPNPNKSPTRGETAVYNSAGTNVFLDALIHETAGKMTPAVWVNQTRSAELTMAIDNLTAAVKDVAQDFEASTAMSDALTYFEAIPQKPDQYLQLTAAGLLKLVEAVAIFALDVAQKIIKLLCDAVLKVLDELWQLLQQAWDIPLLTAMYSKFTNGQTLSTLNLLSLLIATPATVLYKLANGKAEFPDNDPTAAPFPDKAALTTFKSTITAEWIIQQAGLTDTAITKKALPQPDTSALVVARRFSASCYAMNSIAYIGVDIVVDLLSSGETALDYKERWKPDPLLFNRMALAHSWLDPIFSIPWLTGSEGGIGCDNANEFENLAWLLQGIGIALDTIAYVKDGKVTRQAYNGWGVYVGSAWGGVNLGLAIAEAVLKGKDDRAESAMIVMSSIPPVFKWVTAKPGPKSQVGAYMILGLLVLDFICDTTASGIAISEIFKDEEDA